MGLFFPANGTHAVKIPVVGRQQANENLALKLDFAHVWLGLGDHWKDSGDTQGSFVTAVGVRYQF